jgi:hypothetical protein
LARAQSVSSSRNRRAYQPGGRDSGDRAKDECRSYETERSFALASCSWSVSRSQAERVVRNMLRTASAFPIATS